MARHADDKINGVAQQQSLNYPSMVFIMLMQMKTFITLTMMIQLLSPPLQCRLLLTIFARVMIMVTVWAVTAGHSRARVNPQLSVSLGPLAFRPDPWSISRLAFPGNVSLETPCQARWANISLG